MPTKLTSEVSIFVGQQAIEVTFDRAVALAGCRLHPSPVQQLDPTIASLDEALTLEV